MVDDGRIDGQLDGWGVDSRRLDGRLARWTDG